MQMGSAYAGMSFAQRMAKLVDSYECEWKAVLDNEDRLKHFKQFVNR